MAFRGGDGVKYPPPLSGGSTLNTSTCGVEKNIGCPQVEKIFFSCGKQVWKYETARKKIMQRNFYKYEDTAVQYRTGVKIEIRLG